MQILPLFRDIEGTQKVKLGLLILLKVAKGGPCLALGGAFVLERYGETRCVP